MKEKDVLSFSCIELVALFEREFPSIVQGANLSKDWKEFEQFLRGYVRLALAKHSTSSSIKRFFKMFMNEARHIRDFSTGQKIRYEPIKWLWQALRGEGDGIHPDFLLDWYYLFKKYRTDEIVCPIGRDVINGGNAGKPGWMRMLPGSVGKTGREYAVC